MAKLFFSYSHRDEELRNELETHLAMLVRNGVVESWHDRRIPAGAILDQAISSELEAADVILLLLSPHFLASNYCYEVEARRALERHAEGSAVVIPVILQPCDWLASPFRSLRATPTDGKPVAKYANVNDAFVEVTNDIRGALARRVSATGQRTSVDQPGTLVRAAARSSNLRVKRSFTDRERDAFIDETWEYIAQFFENSLTELNARNAAVEVRFVRVTAASFTATVYMDGRKRSGCHIWKGGRGTFAGDIAYAATDSHATNSVNESFRVEDDGLQIGLRATGLSIASSHRRDSLLTQQGAAEALWAAFLGPTQ
jgi:TIR domain